MGTKKLSQKLSQMPIDVLFVDKPITDCKIHLKIN